MVSEQASATMSVINSQTPDDFAHLMDWVGRTAEQTDTITSAPLSALAATLGQRDSTKSLTFVPPLWHWVYFNQHTPRHLIGPDGHALRGGFLPPVSLPRRMWAGGRLDFFFPLQVGDQVTRISTIHQIKPKQGRTGPLVFVDVQHDYMTREGLALTEHHDIVYRGAALPQAAQLQAQVARTDHTMFEQVSPDPVLLFRYSALTFNGHRIHYDRDYATQVEAYPGLVVHGPLLATLQLELLHRHQPNARLTHFNYQAVSPIFDTDAFSVCGVAEDSHEAALWVANGAGGLAMQALARWA
jgi:3-methylfumaryl-CoA hydratase